jgi:hypothetical protein
MAKFKLLFRNLPLGAEESHGRPQADNGIGHLPDTRQKRYA